MAAKKSGIRISAKNINNETLVKVLMRHPMETGAKKDKKTGEVIPSHFIQEVTAESGGKTCFSALLSGGISANPYISFKFKGAPVSRDRKGMFLLCLEDISEQNLRLAGVGVDQLGFFAVLKGPVIVGKFIKALCDI